MIYREPHMDNGSGGWRLRLVCVECDIEDEYRGVVMSLAAQAAERAGWTVDPEALHDPDPRNRWALCPRESREQRAV